MDLLRSLAIILMVMGHIGFGGLFDKWIHAFHMPIWFIISGYFMNTEKDTKQFLIRKAKALLVPYIVFALLYEVLFLVKGHNQFWGMIYPNSVQIPLNGALWFLPALFIAELTGFFFDKIFTHVVCFSFHYNNGMDRMHTYFYTTFWCRQFISWYWIYYRRLLPKTLF